MSEDVWDNPSLLTIPCWLSHAPSKMANPDVTHNRGGGFFYAIS